MMGGNSLSITREITGFCVSHKKEITINAKFHIINFCEDTTDHQKFMGLEYNKYCSNCKLGDTPEKCEIVKKATAMSK
jgi:hypothetical protein